MDKEQILENGNDYLEIPKHLVFAGELLTNVEFRILIAIGYFDPSFPSYDYLMMMTGIKSRHTIAKVLKSLKNKNVLKIRKECFSNKRVRNYYSINTPNFWTGQIEKIIVNS